MYMKYIALLRGINVGGKNKVSMTSLKEYLEELGFSNVTTYINSGNVILESDKQAAEIASLIEDVIPKKFKLDSELIRVLVLSHDQLKSVIDNKPKGFGESPDKYHSDIIFLIGINEDDALAVFNPREGVDTIWPGKGVIYSQRLSSQRTKSRLAQIVGTPIYKQMTIRNYNTVTKLLGMM
jgi:uncharacterized protein (DUF1697 family)